MSAIDKDVSRDENLRRWTSGLSASSASADSASAEATEGAVIGEVFRGRIEQFSAEIRSAGHTRETLEKGRLIQLATRRLDQSRPVRSWWQRCLSFPALFQANYAALAVVFVMGFVLVIWDRLDAPETMGAGDEWIVLRGDEAPQMLTVKKVDLEGRVRAIRELFVRYGVKHLIVEKARGVQIQAKLDPKSEVASELRKLGVATPDHGRLNLVFQIAVEP